MSPGMAWDKVDKNVLIDLYTKKEIPSTEIGILFSVSTNRVLSKLRKLDIHIRTPQEKMSSDYQRKKMSQIGKNSDAVSGHLEKLNKNQKGSNHPCLGGKCSESTILKISNAKRKVKAWQGEKNPNWRNGASEHKFFELHGIELRDWMRLAQNVRKRDKFICQYCVGKHSIVVHHIIPRRVNLDNSMDNLITLCPSCHPKVEQLTTQYLKNNKDPIELFYKKW